VAGETPEALNAPLACEEGTQATGALYQICMPTSWNNELIVYAHGYVAPGSPLAIPAEASQIATVANALGYAFATTIQHQRPGRRSRHG
jgi:hypothetical protein